MHTDVRSDLTVADRSLPQSSAEHIQRVERLFVEQKDSLIRLLRARLHSRDGAEEVARAAHAKMLSEDCPANPQEMTEYLFRTAVSMATGKRCEWRPDVLDLPPHGTSDSPSGRAIVGSQGLTAVSEALARLPPMCRQAFILVRYEGLDFETAGSQLGLHPRKVRRFVQRAFASCQRAIEEQTVVGEGPRQYPKKSRWRHLLSIGFRH
jgi:RNA polymerase sigma-70 factor (ECF subfamily)